MLRTFFGHFWGTIVHPRSAFDELARQPSIRPAVMVLVLGLLLGWLNMLLFWAFGYDWLGTRRELLDPTYVGFFGYLLLGAKHWVPIFAVLNPVLSLLELVVVPGLAHVLSKLWRGQGTFEQMVNTIVFANGVPSIVISLLLNDLLLSGVLVNMLTSHPYAFAAAMQGEFGPVVSTIWGST